MNMIEVMRAMKPGQAATDEKTKCRILCRQIGQKEQRQWVEYMVLIERGDRFWIPSEVVNSEKWGID